MYIKKLPQVLRQLYAFGKVQENVPKAEGLLKMMEVPKRLDYICCFFKKKKTEYVNKFSKQLQLTERILLK